VSHPVQRLHSGLQQPVPLLVFRHRRRPFVFASVQSDLKLLQPSTAASLCIVVFSVNSRRSTLFSKSMTQWRKERCAFTQAEKRTRYFFPKRIEITIDGNGILYFSPWTRMWRGGDGRTRTFTWRVFATLHALTCTKSPIYSLKSSVNPATYNAYEPSIQSYKQFSILTFVFVPIVQNP